MNNYESNTPTVLDLFSGIGGFSLAFEREGFRTIGFSEIDPYACAVLAKHWPRVRNYGDIKALTAEDVAGPVDVITGGAPCQAVSLAGQRRGVADPRFLWSELLRVVSEVRPKFCLFENVIGLLSNDEGRTFAGILSQMGQIGYDCLWNCIPASAVGAPHERDRVWIVAYSQGVQDRGLRLSRIQPDTGASPWTQSKPSDGGVDDGVPFRAQRLKCLGNAIVPACAALFAKEIRKALINDCTPQYR